VQIGRHSTPFNPLATIADGIMVYGLCTVPDREGYNSYGDFMLGRCGLADLCVCVGGGEVWVWGQGEWGGGCQRDGRRGRIVGAGGWGQRGTDINHDGV
jgi:hypothetical protein